MVRELSMREISNIGGASAEGATVVSTGALVGCAAGALAGSVMPGVGTAIGCVAGAISAGGHTLVLWNALN